MWLIYSLCVNFVTLACGNFAPHLITPKITASFMLCEIIFSPHKSRHYLIEWHRSFMGGSAHPQRDCVNTNAAPRDATVLCRYVHTCLWIISTDCKHVHVNLSLSLLSFTYAKFLKQGNGSLFQEQIALGVVPRGYALAMPKLHVERSLAVSWRV